MHADSLPQLLSEWAKYQDLIYAVMILAVIMVLPGGIGTLDELRTRSKQPSGSLEDIFLALT